MQKNKLIIKFGIFIIFKNCIKYYYSNLDDISLRTVILQFFTKASATDKENNTTFYIIQ